MPSVGLNRGTRLPYCVETKFKKPGSFGFWDLLQFAFFLLKELAVASAEVGAAV
jgi:hypothetical protein